MSGSRRFSVSRLRRIVGPVDLLRMALEMSDTRGGSLPWTTSLLVAWSCFRNDVASAVGLNYNWWPDDPQVKAWDVVSIPLRGD